MWEQLLQHIPILILCLVGILVTGTWVLSKILKVQHEKQALLLAKQLSKDGRGTYHHGAKILPLLKHIKRLRVNSKRTLWITSGLVLT